MDRREEARRAAAAAGMTISGSFPTTKKECHLAVRSFFGEVLSDLEKRRRLVKDKLKSSAVLEACPHCDAKEHGERGN